jgi:hypothetical protein
MWGCSLGHGNLPVAKSQRRVTPSLSSHQLPITTPGLLYHLCWNFDWFGLAQAPQVQHLSGCVGKAALHSSLPFFPLLLRPCCLILPQWKADSVDFTHSGARTVTYTGCFAQLRVSELSDIYCKKQLLSPKSGATQKSISIRFLHYLPLPVLSLLKINQSRVEHVFLN